MVAGGVVLALLLTGVLSWAGNVSAAQTLPAAYKIEGVPLYQQKDARGCGAAALQMVFDFYGPWIDQREIYDAARSGGTSLPDMARAAQFSTLSFTAGDRFEQGEVQGYAERAVGYAGFYYASSTPWLEELKGIIAQGYPVIVLVNWLPGVVGPHYRVVVGYDNTKGVLMMNDPWSREFKNDMGYHGSTSQWAAHYDSDFGTFNMTYADFLDTWALSTSYWGVPGLAYGAVLVTPWHVTIRAPTDVAAGKTFALSATVTYPVLAPFGSDTFPMFPASDVAFTLTAGDGLTVLGSSGGPAALAAGGTAHVSWTVQADASGSYALEVSATGLVSGSLGPWQGYPAYDYTDLIGGQASVQVQVTP